MAKKIFIVMFLLFSLYVALVFFSKPVMMFEELLITEAPVEYALVYGKHTAGQILVPKFAHLIKLGFFVFKNDLPPESDLVLHIKNSPDSKKDILRLSSASRDIYAKKYHFMAPQVRTKEGAVYFFQFDPFQYKIGQPLYFYLESPGTSEAGAYKIGVVKNIFRRGYAGGDTYIDGAQSDKHLLFQNYYKLNKGSSELLKDASDRLLQDRPFIIFYLGLCVFLIVMIIILAVMERFFKR